MSPLASSPQLHAAFTFMVLVDRQQVRALIDSLSLFSGAVVVAVLSVVVVWLLAVVCPDFGKLWALIAPFIIAFCLYWSPVWLGADPSEYHAWAFVFILPWFLAGAIPAWTIVRILDKRRVP
jgi:amino acid permease